MGYSPWGHKESDSTEQSTLSLSLQPIHHPLSVAPVVGTRMGIRACVRNLKGILKILWGSFKIQLCGASRIPI